MSLPRHWNCMFGVVCLCLLYTGCSSGQQSRLDAPGIDADAAGKQAIALYDANHDGVISGDELNKCPGIKSALKRFDTNGDGKVTAENIAGRIKKWQESKLAVISAVVTVTLDDNPLGDATVTFEPEPFLGPNVAKVSGKTTDRGVVVLQIDPRTKPGMNPGIYKVRISKQVNGQETIPAGYNANTELGVEVAQDNPDVTLKGIRFDLKSK
jgi:EF hand domain-containing protein